MKAYIVNPGPSEGSQGLGYTNAGVPMQPGGMLFYRGSTQYIFTQDSDGVNTYLGVWKSTDGQSWTPLDQAHRPVIGGFLPRVWFPATGNTCTCYYYSSGTEYLVTFNLTTGLFGTPLSTSYSTRDSGIIVRGNGDVVVAYAQNPAPQHFYVSVLHAGSWTDIAVPALDGNVVLGMTLDKNDHVVFLTSDGSGGVTAAFFDGTTVTVTGSALASADNWTSIGPILYQPTSDRIIVPVKRSDDGSGNEGLSIATITAASTTTPGFSLTNVITDNSRSGEHWKFPNIIQGATEADLIFTWISNPTSVSLVEQVVSNDGGSTWPVTAATYYDPSIDNPVPLPTGPIYTINTLGVVKFAGFLRVVVSFGVAPFSDEVYVLTLPIPVAITRPPDGPYHCPAVYWVDSVIESQGNNELWKSKRLGANSWSAKSLFYDTFINPPTGIPGGFVPANEAGVLAMSGGATTPAKAQATAGDPGLLIAVDDDTDNFQIMCDCQGNAGPAPHPIDATNFVPVDYSQDPFAGHQGSWKYNGYWWCIGSASTARNQRGAQTIRVYSSPDRAIWTEQDAAHHPTSATPGGGIAIQGWHFDGVSNQIHVAYMSAINMDGSGTLSLIEFTLGAGGAGTWGSDHDALSYPNSGADGIDGNLELVFSSVTGITHIAYVAKGPSNTLSYRFLQAGVWSTTINFTPNTIGGSPYFSAIVLDPDGVTIHTFPRTSGGGGGGTNLGYQQIRAGGVLGPTAGPLDIGEGGAGGGDAVSYPLISRNLLLVPLDYNNPDNPGSSLVPAAWVATDLDNPIFSLEFIDRAVNDVATCSYGAFELCQGGSYAYVRDAARAFV